MSPARVMRTSVRVSRWRWRLIVSVLSGDVSEVGGAGSVLGVSMDVTKDARFGLELEPGVV